MLPLFEDIITILVQPGGRRLQASVFDLRVPPRAMAALWVQRLRRTFDALVRPVAAEHPDALPAAAATSGRSSTSTLRKVAAVA